VLAPQLLIRSYCRGYQRRQSASAHIWHQAQVRGRRLVRIVSSVKCSSGFRCWVIERQRQNQNGCWQTHGVTLQMVFSGQG